MPKAKPLKLLIVEDNITIAKQLCEFFEGLGWCVDHAAAGRLAIDLALAEHFDVVLLDINLPDVDGFEVCRDIKALGSINTPILMLTARDAFSDKAQGFGDGADDYVTKPFDFRELALRCQALARRQDLHRSHAIELGDLRIDKNSEKAWREGVELTLTSVAFKILVVLAEAWPQAVTRSFLMHTIWGENVPTSDALRSHIYAIRNQLDKPFHYPMLKTMVNVGFRLEVQDAT